MNVKYFKTLIIPSVFCLLLFSCGQKKTTNYDNGKLIKQYISQSKDSFYTNINFSRKVLLKALKIAKDSLKYYDIYEAYSNTYFVTNQFNQGFSGMKKVVDFLQSQPESKMKSDILSSAYNSMGAIYGKLGKYQEALKYLNNAIKYCQEAKSKPDIYINLSDNYKQVGDCTNAILCMKKALMIVDSLKLKDMEFPIYSSLGDIYLDLRNFERSNYFYTHAEKDYLNRTKTEQIVFCNNRGNYYYYSKSYKKAEIWLVKAKELAEELKDQYHLYFSYVNLADVYLNLSRYKQAEYYANKSIPFFKSIEFTTALCYINAIKIGLAVKQGNISQAQKLEKEYKSDGTIEPNILLIRNKYLEELSVKEKDYKSAYNYLVESNAINDSIRNELTKKTISEISMRYSQDTTIIKKELLIQKQKAEVRSLRLSTLLWILVCILIIISTIFIYIYINRKHKIQRMKYIEQMTTFRISNIRNRISPHFMFNVLNNEMQNIDEEQKNHFYILIHLLRKSLELTEQISIKLSDEINFVKSFVELQKYKVGDNFKMTWNIDPSIELDKHFIIPMMLQIPIENSIKHGLSQIREGDKLLDVVITNTVDSIKISITDNGMGFHPETTTITKGTGTGLKVLNQTIQILNDRNANKITYIMKNIEEPGKTGAETDIYIPYQYKFEYK